LKQISGGVHFLADWPACYRANLHSRIATRILCRVAHGRYAKEEDIYQLALDTAWPKWFLAEQTIRVDVNAVKSPLKSIEFVTLRIKDAVCDRFRRDFGRRPSVDTRQPDVRVQGFISSDECTLYLDTSGAPLYQRGFRQKTVEAPLRENLAAGILAPQWLAAGHPAARPDVWQWHVSDRGRPDSAARGAGRQAGFCFPEAASFRFRRLENAARRGACGRKTACRCRNFRQRHFAGGGARALANLDRAGLLPAVSLRSGDLLDIEAPAGSAASR
jgi:putative N6-adenine-specific DNA methylase